MVSNRRCARAALTFVAEDSVFRADFEWCIEVFEGDKLLMSDSWKSTSYADSKNEILPRQTLLSQKSLQMKAGEYTIKTDRRDLRGTAADLAKQALRNYYESGTEKEIDEEFDAAKWIADTEELKIYKQLNLEQKKEFLARYWVRRDQRPDTIANEFRQDYLRRVRYAADNFGGLRPGWQTERGRVLLKYGTPDQVERFPSSSNNLRDYEIWYYYDVEGGVNFYFVPLLG